MAELGHYKGPLDWIDGPITRAALADWLDSLGEVGDAGSFQDLAESWGLRYFNPSELLTKGASNGRLKLNTDPPKALWENIKDAALAADEARHRLGSGIIVASAYRSPAYNKAIGGASNSFHTKFRALDLFPANGDVSKLHGIITDLRREGYEGASGIGRYRTFCHIDNGPNRDW